MPYTTITVSVPEGTEADLLRYAASLAGRTAAVEAEQASEEVEEFEMFDQVRGNGRRPRGFGQRTVRESYLGGVSEVWRPFLEYLADRPDEWVAWPDLCRHIDRTPRQASGVLGAAERRCGGLPPYEKKQEGDDHYFRMPGYVAHVIQGLREEE